MTIDFDFVFHSGGKKKKGKENKTRIYSGGGKKRRAVN
jgi:hypothetical protein